MISKELEPFLDFWLEGQRQGFAGALPRIKLPDGSKMVALHKHPLLYVDQWRGSDMGGGQTLLYFLSEPWAVDVPQHVVGTPLLMLNYVGERVYDFSRPELEQLKGTFGNISSSEIIWKMLKSALGQVNRERPLRGPASYKYPECPDLTYTGEEEYHPFTEMITGKELIKYKDNAKYGGFYSFVPIKKSFGDRFPEFPIKQL